MLDIKQVRVCYERIRG